MSAGIRGYKNWSEAGGGEYQLEGATIDQAVVSQQQDKLVEIVDMQAGQEDIIAQTKQYSVLVGNREWMKRNGLEVTLEVDRAMELEEEQGRTSVVVAIDGRLVAVVAIADTVKPEAYLTVYTLKRRVGD